MTSLCNRLHLLCNGKARYRHPFVPTDIPDNGIYVLFEVGERAHGGERIVRIGTHTGQDNFRSRLKEHFTLRKDRSIFRKNIGRALLNSTKDPFLADWNIDLTKKDNRERYGPLIDHERQAQVEQQVSDYMEDAFSFVVIPMSDKHDRKRLESAMISTVSLCPECKPSSTWLGLQSPKPKHRKSGLWLEQGLWKTEMNQDDYDFLEASGEDT